MLNKKALKGFLYAKGFRALVTHSVSELVEEAAKAEKAFERFRDPSKELDRHSAPVIQTFIPRVLLSGITRGRWLNGA